MTEFILRHCTRAGELPSDTAVRSRCGTVAGAVGILCNVLLCLAKLFLGFVSGSVSVMADAFNNLSDAASSIMTLLGFQLAKKPADEEHPYGHARFEYLAGLAVSILIIVLGIQMLKSAVGRMLNPAPVAFSVLLCLILLLSIGVKLWMAVFYRSLAKKIESLTLEAAAVDSRNDVLSTGAVLVCLLVMRFSGWDLDAYVAFVVSLFIVYSGIQVGRETLRPLLGSAPDGEILALLRKETLDFDPCIVGVHDVIVHDYGPRKRFASLHAEIPYTYDVLLAHDAIDGVERFFRDFHDIELVIHYDPVVLDDEELNGLRDAMLSAIAQIDESLSAHDFRLVRGAEQSNLIFDVVLPYALAGQEKQIAKTLEEQVKTLGKYHSIVCFDFQGMRPS